MISAARIRGRIGKERRLLFQDRNLWRKARADGDVEAVKKYGCATGYRMASIRKLVVDLIRAERDRDIAAVFRI